MTPGELFGGACCMLRSIVFTGSRSVEEGMIGSDTGIDLVCKVSVSNENAMDELLEDCSHHLCSLLWYVCRPTLALLGTTNIYCLENISHICRQNDIQTKNHLLKAHVSHS